jgi:signal transduction histidine kinase
MANMYDHRAEPSSYEEFRAERDRFLSKLDLSRKALVAEQETQYSAYRQLVKWERVRAFEETSRGIQHRLCNKLTPAEGFAELLLADADPGGNPEHLREYSQIMLQATQDAKNVIGSMRDFYYNAAVDFERHQRVSEILSKGLNEEA